MKMDVREFLGSPRDSVREAALAQKLRALNPDDALSFVLDYIQEDEVVGLELAKRSLRRRVDFEVILEKGLRAADASSIRFWLSCCLDRVGARRALGLLRKLAHDDIDACQRVLYRTRIALVETDPDLRAELETLSKQVGDPVPPGLEPSGEEGA